jgi:hypothetical protein
MTLQVLVERCTKMEFLFLFDILIYQNQALIKCQTNGQNFGLLD